jgi:hypothetical protein
MPGFIGAFGRLLKLQKVSLLPSSPSMRVWGQYDRSLDRALPLNKRHLRSLMANDPVDHA